MSKAKKPYRDGNWFAGMNALDAIMIPQSAGETERQRQKDQLDARKDQRRKKRVVARSRHDPKKKGDMGESVLSARLDIRKQWRSGAGYSAKGDLKNEYWVGSVKTTDSPKSMTTEAIFKKAALDAAFHDCQPFVAIFEPKKNKITGFIPEAGGWKKVDEKELKRVIHTQPEDT